MNVLDIEDIRPYNDSEAVKALKKASFNPLTLAVSRYVFPGESVCALSRMLRNVKGVDDFQNSVMSSCVKSIMDRTSDGLSVEGLENVRALTGRGFVVMSNHRDIVVDPALLQYSFFLNGLPLTELCVGSNLLSSGYVSDLMRSNRMVKVMRGLSAREIYSSSRLLSTYIRDLVVKRKSPIWIAQREGRAKDGVDKTEQAVLKMLDMSGEGSFEDKFCSLPIVPMAISYEYESCDALRTREICISRRHKYVKRRGEDMHSILTGIRQYKGSVHISFGKPLSSKEISEASSLKGNERYKFLCDVVDTRILEGYRLWPNNFIAADMLEGGSSRAAKYNASQYDSFCSYVEKKLDSIKKIKENPDRDELRRIFLEIYANPVLRKEQAGLV